MPLLQREAVCVLAREVVSVQFGIQHDETEDCTHFSHGVRDETPSVEHLCQRGLVERQAVRQVGNPHIHTRMHWLAPGEERCTRWRTRRLNVVLRERNPLVMQGVERWCFDLVVVREAEVIVPETPRRAGRGWGQRWRGAHCALRRGCTARRTRTYSSMTTKTTCRGCLAAAAAAEVQSNSSWIAPRIVKKTEKNFSRTLNYTAKLTRIWILLST